MLDATTSRRHDPGMRDKLRRQWIQIAVVLAVLGLFAANAAGMFRLLLDVGPGSSSLAAVVASPEFLVLLAVGIVLSALLPVLSPIRASALTLAAALPFVYLGFQPSPEPPLVPMEYSLLTVLMLFAVNVLASYYVETSRKQRLISAFGQYLPPELVRTISRNPDHFSLESEARELTVMFCDIHDFTTIAEQLGPKQLAALLNTLFTPLTEAIYRHHGTIDKYMGDAIMAFWGAPLPEPRHARRALAAAFDMQSVVRRMAPVFRDKGWPEVRMGIGINTGIVNVGNMGSEYRMAYTVIGDPVNLASRLEELNRTYGTGIIVGEATRRAVESAAYRELDLVQVKGKNQPTRIYEPLALEAAEVEPECQRAARDHQQALEHYYARNWEAARGLFRELAVDRPRDPVPGLYLRRIEAFLREPPPAEWAGEARYTGS